MKQWFIETVWRGWFRDSEVMALGWLQTALGMLATAWEFIAAALAAMDWYQLVSMAQFGGVSSRQAIFMSVILFVQGAVTVVARRARDPEMQ